MLLLCLFVNKSLSTSQRSNASHPAVNPRIESKGQESASAASLRMAASSLLAGGSSAVVDASARPSARGPTAAPSRSVATGALVEARGAAQPTSAAANTSQRDDRAAATSRREATR